MCFSTKKSQSAQNRRESVNTRSCVKLLLSCMWIQQVSSSRSEMPKIVMIGPGGHGKSCLIMNLLGYDFNGEYDPTIEDSYETDLNMGQQGPGDIVDIVDTSGQQEYVRTTVRDKVEEADAIMLFFQLSTNVSELGELDIFLREILRRKVNRVVTEEEKVFDANFGENGVMTIETSVDPVSTIPILLVATKSDRLTPEERTEAIETIEAVRRKIQEFFPDV